ncbi:predicted protein [Plenodomus lingam JN3]|uniref:Uncharacterized protein n=1 Tax=Leptosphaeria maculans (strain JN3 / isolate v23.1.3 / race Av1-4-5-6-7-8) TaxID=985895 RepID=E5A5Y6_LEPMJ|nr:predicted protein [Plenodomus lingam JN3]CBX99031.1 predicted protein [Plenodomus lingam JN3]
MRHASISPDTKPTSTSVREIVLAGMIVRAAFLSLGS